jgi:hypothetical protein
VCNGTFVIGIRPSSAYAKIIFAADNSRTARDSNGKSPMILAQHPAGQTGGKNLDRLLDTA